MNLSRIIERWAQHTPDKLALHFQGEDLSYAALWERVEQTTRELARLDIGHGDRIAFLDRIAFFFQPVGNHAFFHIAQFGHCYIFSHISTDLPSSP